MSIRDAVIKWLGGEPKRRTFVVDPEWKRSEELRVDRLGLDEDIIVSEDREWKPPPGAVADRWRPRTTLDPP